MSENPYAPPQAVLATPQTLAGGSGTIDLGRCMQEAWRGTWANFPLWLVAGIVWLLALIASFATVIGIGLVVPVLYWGGYAFFLKMHDGGARIGDLFSGFSRYGQALIGMLGFFVVSILIGIPAQIALQYGAPPPRRWWLVAVGYLRDRPSSLFVTPRLNCAPFLMVDRQLGLGEALSQSWSRTSEIKGPLALLTLLMVVAMIVSVLALIVGMLPGMVFVFLLWVSAYRQIFGGPRAS